MTLPDAPYLIITFADTTVCFGIHICFTICGAATSSPWTTPIPLAVTTRLERGVLSIRPEALEAGGDKALG